MTGDLAAATPDKRSKPGSSGKRIAVILVFLLAALLVAFLVHRGVSFDSRTFVQQLHHIAVVHAIAGTLLIYASYLLRSYRWAIFLRRQKQIGPLTLLGTQFTGFAAVALFGRIADLSRPYLVAQKARLPLPGQIAVYTIERMFDLGAAALVFSSALAFTPRDLPHHEIFIRVGLASLAGTLFLAVFAVVVRVAGVRLAAFARRVLARISPRLGRAVEGRILAFREGLNAITSLWDFVLVTACSLGLWLMIALSYVETVHAFVLEPTLAELSFSRTMLLLGASIGGSLLQLPILGWFTQIATTAAAMHAFYGTPIEPATACGGLLLLVTFISVIPIGLIFARVDRVRLGDLRKGAEAQREKA